MAHEFEPKDMDPCPIIWALKLHKEKMEFASHKKHILKEY